MSEHFTKVQRRIGLGLASAMLVGGGIEGVNLASPDTPTFQNGSEVSQIFADKLHYWTTVRHLGALAGSKLIKVGEGGDVDSYTCPGRPGTAQPDNDVISGYSVSEVCLATETVVITPADLITGPGGLDFIIGHEIGHRVGQVEKQLDNWDNSRPNQALASEQSATCYAGMEIKADSPSSIGKVSKSLRTDSAVDPIHGSGDQQADAFIQGTQVTDLDACSVEHFLG